MSCTPLETMVIACGVPYFVENLFEIEQFIFMNNFPFFWNSSMMSNRYFGVFIWWNLFLKNALFMSMMIAARL